MNDASPYDVFLSHNSHDKPLVEQIARRLVDEAKLRPFFDQWHLIPGESWQEKLPEAIRRSSTVAAFIGPSGNGPGHHEEMQVALKSALREKQEFRVIPVLLPGADASSMPEFLQRRMLVDFSAGTNNDIAFKRLVAGILGEATELEDITLRTGAMTLGELFAETNLGKSMDEADQAAFRVGAALSQASSAPLNSYGVLVGYLLTAKPGKGQSEQALAKAAWDNYSANHPNHVKPENVEMWRIISKQCLDSLVKLALDTPRHTEDWKLSAGLGAMLLRSVEVATEADRHHVEHPSENSKKLPSVEVATEADRPQPFSTRHLLACLLGPREWRLDPEGTAEISKIDLDLPTVRSAFREWIRNWRREDNSAVMDDVLGLTDKSSLLAEEARRALKPENKDQPTTNGYTSGPAGYTSEFCGMGGSGPVPDYLGVEALAHRLAELMALRETKLPLAVGLFANWGSGKSHFMNLMDRHMKKLARETPDNWGCREGERDTAQRLDPTGEGPWCREIVPIYFNAWHYNDTNLWASLVTEIFDGLFAHLLPKQDELALMRSRLRDAGGATARAEEEATQAHEAVRQASAMLQKARVDTEGARQAVKGLLDNLRSLLPQVNTPENQRRITEWLGVSAEVATLSQLVAKHREMGSLTGRLRELWHRATAREGRAGRFVWLLGALIVVPGLVWLGAALVPQIGVWLKWLGPWVQAALAALTGAVGWMIPVFNHVQRRLGQMETWQKQAEEAQAALPKDQKVIDAQEKVVQAEATAVAAEAGLAVARALEQQFAQAADELRPERRLSRFIETRARSADYRGQLGLVSLARRDFQELRGCESF